ncbi:MAG: hypothetical protein KGL26_01120 [Pseudomonadota bacterium]|nr:hypothetical protein [Pseudomonadota bacterium]
MQERDALTERVNQQTHDLLGLYEEQTGARIGATPGDAYMALMCFTAAVTRVLIEARRTQGIDMLEKALESIRSEVERLEPVRSPLQTHDGTRTRQ